MEMFFATEQTRRERFMLNILSGSPKFSGVSTTIFKMLFTITSL